VNDRSRPNILYSTSACHLCETAEELLLGLAPNGSAISFEKVDIAESEALFTRFGLRIPVVSNASGAELGWPFSADELLLFLTQ
jgi:hypothetical protein